MANIPVEKKGGAPWLWWLLGILLLGGLIWGLAEAFDDEEPELAVVDPAVPEMTEPDVIEEPATSTMDTDITSLETILESNNPQELVGRSVNLTGVTAVSVTGDSTYWIYNPDEDVSQRVFVVLYQLGESEPGPGTGADGVYNVDPSENMEVEGQIMAVEPNDPDVWGVTGEEAAELREYQVYIRANDLENLNTVSENM